MMEICPEQGTCNCGAICKIEHQLNELIQNNTKKTPLVMDGYPEAQNVWLVIDHQSFCVTPSGCETDEEAEMFRTNLAVALNRLVNKA